MPAVAGTRPRKRARPALPLRLALLTLAVALAGTVSAMAFQALPSGDQVNDDAAAGIEKTQSVGNEDPANSDVVGGALVAGKPAVPWAVFRQQEASGAKDQIFSRSFAGGAWTTRGTGTVGGSSSSSPTFTGSLNFDQTQDGEAPAIDFAGAGRTVPWATWYEQTTGAKFNNDNVFASRFDSVSGRWIFGGQARGAGGTSGVPVPSLNIHTNQSAENPSVAGGSAVDPTKPGPWVTWQETTSLPVAEKDQIFVERPEGPGQTNCETETPKGVEDVTGHIPAIGGFCWQQTGVPRVGIGTTDPSLNIDPRRNGVEPDIAFTGANDAVPWVVWYETEPGTIGRSAKELVFAAKGVHDGEGANGGFHWVAVGSRLQGELGTSGTSKFGPCLESLENEEHCSLNKNPEADAEDPRVAAGTMNPANPTVPWVAWDEKVGTIDQIFVARLVGAGGEAHFEVVNGGAPISTGANSSRRPDMTFSGNTPYVSWREDVGGGVERASFGHFVNAASPTFQLDESGVPLASNADVREPISSSCIATPFNGDGAACQGEAQGTPFFLFTNGTGPLGLFAGAFAPETPVTGEAGAVTTSTATVAGSVNPLGASVHVSFEYGTTTAYGQSAGGSASGVSDSAVPFSAALTGLPANTTIHYRAVATSDLGTFVGADRTLTTAREGSSVTTNPPPGASSAKTTVAQLARSFTGSRIKVHVSCTGPSGTSCKLTLRLTVVETLKGHRVVGVTAAKKRRRTVTVGSATVTLAAGQATTVSVSLNRTGRRLLAKRHGRLKVRVVVTQAGVSAPISIQIASLKPAKRR